MSTSVVQAQPRRIAANCLKPARSAFRVFDSLAHTGKPDLRPLGMTPVHIVDRDFWADMKTLRGVDPVRVQQVVAALPDNDMPIILDIEHFDLRSNPQMTERETRELIEIIRAFKKAAPGRPIGYYGFFPLGGYGREIEAGDAAATIIWQRQNDAMHRLLAEVDFLAPSLYTLLDNPAGWTTQARATICEARRLSKKPVYPFLWPEFHEGSPFKNTPVPVQFWTVQIDTLARYADGMVLWDGWDFVKSRIKPWDGNAPWWRITKSRLEHWRRNRWRHPKSDEAS
jgi:hypothetical protein